MTSTPSWIGSSSSGGGTADPGTFGNGEADLLGFGDVTSSATTSSSSFGHEQTATAPATSFQHAATAAAPSSPAGYMHDPYGGTTPVRSDSAGVAEEYGEVGLHPTAHRGKPTGKAVGGAAVAGGSKLSS